MHRRPILLRYKTYFGMLASLYANFFPAHRIVHSSDNKGKITKRKRLSLIIIYKIYF